MMCLPSLLLGGFTMVNFIHFTLDDRSHIEHDLNSNINVSTIATSLGRSHSSIQREIDKHVLFIRDYGFTKTNDCALADSCKKHHVCSSACTYKKGRCKFCGNCNSLFHCLDYTSSDCVKLASSPHVCNGCTHIKSCRFIHHIYHAVDANNSYKLKLVDCRSGIDSSVDEMDRMNAVLLKGLSQNQSLHAIMVANADIFTVDERTLYNYIEAGYFDVRNLDLPRKCKLKPRKSKKRQSKVDKKCRVGRTYSDFLNFTALHPDLPIVEMDSVEGIKGGKVILTLFFRNSSLQCYFLRDHNDAQSVIAAMDMLYEKTLGPDLFKKMMPIILTDNGSEFSNPLAIEFDALHDRRSFVFYCDPSASFQKGACERNHEFYRYFYPKGTSFDDLEQNQLDLISSHLNSYVRKKLNNQSPSALFSFLYGEDILHQLSLKVISPNDVTLSLNILK